MTIPLAATNWVDGIGMEVDADTMNDIGVALNASTQGRPQINTITSSATPAINTDNCTQFTITALATAITSMSSGLTGTPQDGQKLVLRIKDNGIPRAITWGAKWRGIGMSLPVKTTTNGWLYVEAFYNSADSVWDVVVARRQVVPLQIVSSNSAAASSVSLPTHAPGDLILIFAFNNASTALPAAPAASGTVPAWATSDSGTGNTCSALLASFFATANNHTSGTWTNTSGMVAVVVRNPDGAAPLGGHTVAAISGSASAAASPTVTPSKTDGTSVLLYFYGHRNMTSWDAAPAGSTRLTQAVSTTGVCCNSKNDTTSDGSITQTLSGSLAGIMGAVVELVTAT